MSDQTGGGPPPSHDRPVPGDESVVHDAEIEKADGDDTMSAESALVTLDPKDIAISAIDRAAIDSQVATAKKYPRSVTKALREARTLVALDRETAQSMLYAVKRGGKLIPGPSVRLAEVMAHAWGNLRIDTTILEEGRTMLTAAGTCFDLEKNVAIRSTVKRRITTSTGQRYNDDMIVTTANAASSIALRNAIFKVIPRALVNSVYKHAKKVAVGEGASMTETRQQLLDWFGKVGVKPEQIFQLLDVKGLDDVGEDQIVVLRGLANAIKDGEQKVERLFGPDTEPSQATNNLNEAIKAKAAGATQPAAAVETKAETPAPKAQPAKSERRGAQSELDSLEGGKK